MNSIQHAQSYQQKRFNYHAHQSDSYHFFNLLTGSEFFDKLEEQIPDHRERLFPPTETLSMFLAQAMNEDRSCQNIMNDSAIKRLLGGLPSCSTYTGAYCRARKRLPLPMVKSLSCYAGTMISQQSLPKWHWHDRPVRLVDGTTLSMPDTAENQSSYPQLSGQKPGLGFPVCRLVSLLCLGSGAMLDAAISPLKGKGSDEQSLLRAILESLNRNDVLLGDAYYATYFLYCSLQTMGVDAVFEQHGSRRLNTDFRRGTKLGKRDHLIALTKPKKCPLFDEYDLRIWVVWSQQAEENDGERWQSVLILIAQNKVGNRPGRVEPRAVKRRPKPFRLLTKTRSNVARQEIRANGHPKKLK